MNLAWRELLKVSAQNRFAQVGTKWSKLFASLSFPHPISIYFHSPCHTPPLLPPLPSTCWAAPPLRHWRMSRFAFDAAVSGRRSAPQRRQEWTLLAVGQGGSSWSPSKPTFVEAMAVAARAAGAQNKALGHAVVIHDAQKIENQSGGSKVAVKSCYALRLFQVFR